MGWVDDEKCKKEEVLQRKLNKEKQAEEDRIRWSCSGIMERILRVKAELERQTDHRFSVKGYNCKSIKTGLLGLSTKTSCRGIRIKCPRKDDPLLVFYEGNRIRIYHSWPTTDYTAGGSCWWYVKKENVTDEMIESWFGYLAVGAELKANKEK
jgi:hypothetical protein